MNQKELLKLLTELKNIKEVKGVNPTDEFVRNSKIRILNTISIEHKPLIGILIRRITAVIGAVAMLLTSGVAVVAQTSEPGDILYPVKKVTEKVVLDIAPTPELKSKVTEAIIERRVEEEHTIKEKAQRDSGNVKGTNTKKENKIQKVKEVKPKAPKTKNKKSEIKAKKSTEKKNTNEKSNSSNKQANSKNGKNK